MGILVVDDSPTTLKVFKSYLNEAGYTDCCFVESAQGAFQELEIGSDGSGDVKIDLILLDIMLPDMDGREACRIIKSIDHLKDIPVIIVTALTEMEHLEKAFENGAIDYITKPINKIELLARIRSALRLKMEMDRRKARELNLLEVTIELEKAVERLHQLSSLDGLTGIANRRRFDEYVENEWKKGKRNAKPISLILADIDFFKVYNDTYGHQAGDECLKAVAVILQNCLKRPGDLVCRYGGEEFAVVLPETPKNGAVVMADSMRASVEATGIPHENSGISPNVTMSFGVATILPNKDLSPVELIAVADRALYEAKDQGRNCLRVANVDQLKK